jgi:Flp pilus assembly pilin Flp
MENLILKLYVRLRTLVVCEDGQNLVEYGLIVALIVFGVTAAMRTVSTDISMIYSAISSTVASSLG